MIRLTDSEDHRLLVESTWFGAGVLELRPGSYSLEAFGFCGELRYPDRSIYARARCVRFEP